jgi:hypothetical protein
MKIFKEEFLLRPIVNTLGAPPFQLSKRLAGTLAPLVGCSTHHAENMTVFFNLGLPMNQTAGFNGVFHCSVPVKETMTDRQTSCDFFNIFEVGWTVL